MLAGGAGMPADPERFQFEPKLDGQRLIARVWDRTLELRTRNGNDATAAYPELAVLADAFDPGAVLDGELIAPGDDGRPSFGRLQRRMHVRRPPPSLVADVPVVYVVFDLLWIAGEPLVELPQSERSARLDGAVQAGPLWQRVARLTGDADDLEAGARAVGLEGLMAKRLDAPYRPGQRSDAWRKVKWRRVREFVVGGWAAGEGNRHGTIGSLAVGYVDRDACGDDLLDRPCLRYVGQVGSGLSGALCTELQTAFDRYERSTPPFVNPPRVPPLRWVAPLLVVQVGFTEVTREGTLRHPALLGVRGDVTPSEVVWDEELRPAAE